MKLRDLLRSKTAQFAERAERRAAAGLANAARSIAGVSARADGGTVELSGRGLHRRAETDARLRWPGAWLKGLR